MADNFLKTLPKRVEISSVALQMLMAYSWPGNIRELKNVIESAAVVTDGGFIEPAQLPGKITGLFAKAASSLGSGDLKLPVSISLDDKLKEIERSLIIEALTKTGGVQTRATELLGINQRSLWHRIKKLNIDVKSLKNYEA